MRASIYKPSSPILRGHIDYFLFLENNSGEGFYKTFPNTNICLAFYKNNSVKWDRFQNTCEVSRYTQQETNKLYAFHRKPFSVIYNGKVEQICILFKMESVSLFSRTPISEIDPEDDPAHQLLGRDAVPLTERLFSISNKEKQLELLESFLIKKIKPPSPGQQQYFHALNELKKTDTRRKAVVDSLSDQLNINPSTLYRHFLSLFGQAPLDIYKTVRFRKALAGLLSGKQAFTKVAYDNDFFDQSHFIKDIRQFTGESPHSLLRSIADVEGTLLWMRK